MITCFEEAHLGKAWKKLLSGTTRARALIFGMYKMFVCGGGGGGRVLLYSQRPYYGRDQLDCSPPNGLNHYLPLNKTGAHSIGVLFRATMALLFIKAKGIMLSPPSVIYAISS